MIDKVQSNSLDTNGNGRLDKDEIGIGTNFFEVAKKLYATNFYDKYRSELREKIEKFDENKDTWISNGKTWSDGIILSGKDERQTLTDAGYSAKAYNADAYYSDKKPVIVSEEEAQSLDKINEGLNEANKETLDLINKLKAQLEEEKKQNPNSPDLKETEAAIKELEEKLKKKEKSTEIERASWTARGRAITVDDAVEANLQNYVMSRESFATYVSTLTGKTISELYELQKTDPTLPLIVTEDEYRTHKLFMKFAGTDEKIQKGVELRSLIASYGSKASKEQIAVYKEELNEMPKGKDITFLDAEQQKKLEHETSLSYSFTLEDEDGKEQTYNYTYLDANIGQDFKVPISYTNWDGSDNADKKDFSYGELFYKFTSGEKDMEETTSQSQTEQ
ncbi:MAG: hypothetical protein V4691_07245 [Pseudomonadota bacterium]